MRKRILLILMMAFVIAALSNTAFAITMPKTTEAVCPTCTRNGGGTWPTDKFTTTWTLQSVDWTSTQGYHQGVYKCNGCGDTARKFLGQHSYSDYWPNGEPIAGYTAGRWCNYCGYVAEEPQESPCEHSFTNKPSDQLAKPANCTEPATYYVQCDDCDEVSLTRTVSVGEPLGHDYGAWEQMDNGYRHSRTCQRGSCWATSYADCSGGTATCVQKAECEVCGAEYGDYGPHSFTDKPSDQLAGAATCTEGTRYYVQCDNCDAVSDTVTVAVGEPAGHDWRWSSFYDGTHQARCSECDEQTTREAHTVPDGKGVACIEEGTVCPVCSFRFDSGIGHDWQSNGNGTHSCTRCDVAAEDCSGGEATCQSGAVCESCGGEYTEKAEHNYYWSSFYDGTHQGRCGTCGTQTTREAHTVPDGKGVACVEEGTVCPVCSFRFDSGIGHDWQSNGNGTHSCTRCDVAAEDCSGGEATCQSGAVCESCGGEYTEKAEHNYYWSSFYDGTHQARCSECGEQTTREAHTVPEGKGVACIEEGTVCPVCSFKFDSGIGHDYSGPDATCTEDKVCAREGCDVVLEEAKGHDYSGAPATCTTAQVCAREGCTVVLEEAKGHDYSGPDATCTEDKVCVREGCGAVLEEAIGHDYSGAPATCTTTQVCTREGCDVVLEEAKGHDYSGAPATCTSAQVCAREGCGAVLEEAIGHDYSGPDATCTEDKVCAREGCDVVLEEAKGHDYSGPDATCTEDKVCAREGCTVVLEEAKGHDYSGPDATCTENKVCAREGCGAVLDSAKGHDYSGAPATCTSAQVCAREGCTVVLEEAKGHDYSGHDATCTEDKVCAREGCGAVLDSAKGHDYSGAPATCTSAQVCAREGCTVVLEEAKGHDYSGPDATCTEDKVCAREGCEVVLDSAKGHDYSGAPATCTTAQVCAREGCGAVLDSAKGHTEEIITGKPATCTETGLTDGVKCSVCQEILTAQQTIPMTAHDYKAFVTAPTCTEGGYTTYTCANCKASHTADETAAYGHYYGVWTFNGDDTHSALCRRDACGHTGMAACEWFDWQLFMRDMEDEPEYRFIFCPVCGEVNDGARLLLAEMVEAKALTEKLPAGEIVLRMGELQNGEAVMSVGFEYGGELTQPTGEVKVTLPVALLEGYALTLLDEDGTEIELPFTVEEEMLSFTLDFTPVEGEENLPVRVIRLISTAQ